MCKLITFTYHLRLVKRGVNSANTKMRLLHPFFGLLTIGLITQNGLADISLKLREANSKGSFYLPPKQQEIHIQHINQPPIDNTNNRLDVSILSIAAAATDGVLNNNLAKASLAPQTTKAFAKERNEYHQISSQAIPNAYDESLQYNLPSHTQINIPKIAPAQFYDNHQQAEGDIFKGPEYLPPYDNSVYNSDSDHSRHSNFKGPNYLPPHIENPSDSLGGVTGEQLPDGYDFENPELRREQQQSQEEQYRLRQTVHDQEQKIIPTHLNNRLPPQTNKPLPPGYDFVKPPNAEQAINQLHSQQQNYEQPQYDGVLVHTQIEVQGEDVSNVAQDLHTDSNKNYHSHTQISYNKAQEHQQLTNVHHHHHQHHQQQQQYLPPAHLHSLSSYMTSIQPHQRYGSTQFSFGQRIPFPQYGPPAQHSHHNTLLTTIEEAALMYREQANHIQSYAPQQLAYELKEQAQKSLSQSIPNEIQQQSAIPLEHQHFSIAPSAVTSNKIRTVQIINSANAVKTLKVLEAVDSEGVKTIKILGTSNENPVGDHSVIKVINQNAHNPHENHVQTIKIFNDQQDVSVENADGITDGLVPPYLPPEAN